MGGYRINNAFNITISNMLTLLLFNRKHHNILSNHSSCSIFLTVILFIFAFSLFFIPMPTICSYVTFFPTIEAFSSFLKLRFISWFWPIIKLSPIIKSSTSTSTFEWSLWYAFVLELHSLSLVCVCVCVCLFVSKKKQIRVIVNN